MAKKTENSGCSSGYIGCIILLVGFGLIVGLIENSETRGGTIAVLVILIIFAFLSATSNKDDKDKQQKPVSKNNTVSPNQQNVPQTNQYNITQTSPSILKDGINEQQQVKPAIKDATDSDSQTKTFYDATTGFFITIKKPQTDNVSQALEFARNNCESPIEEQFWEIAQHEIPGLIPQFEISSYRVDFALPEKKIAIELDGHDYHKTKEQRTSDAQRERDLQKVGWTVIRFTGTEINRNVHRCIEDIKEICKQI